MREEYRYEGLRLGGYTDGQLHVIVCIVTVSIATLVVGNVYIGGN